ncbi:glycosyltransferase family 2 protein [Sanguibacter sp. HDW7]|uniref:glycosyltransferase family 2 protein n=1 Tax=Sanguibacter sp. HDW7 TaxID=2714931 RepID=UPI00140A0C15|nr:glycosyltransferase family 2 protein [Sanguibacter sp. HDW7]QIK82959.1 glycosyltransferase family 2 protein [Sanguibacter sp. HDW7]
MSVVVPARDQAEHVEAALLSLTRQLDDPRELEVVVVDDGSVDGTGDLVEAMSGRFARLELVRNDMPTGVANARNAGLALARGRHVAFLDPDDWFARGHLQHLSDALERLGVDFVRCDHVRDLHGTRSVRAVPEHRRGLVLDPREGIGPAHLTTPVDYPFVPFGLYDARLHDEGLLGFVAGLHTAEDRAWIWRMHLHARTWAVVDGLGAFYRRGTPTSLTRVLDRRQLDVVHAYREIFLLVRRDPAHAQHWAKAVRQLLAMACHHLARFEEARLEADLLGDASDAHAHSLLADELRDGVDVTLAIAPPEVVGPTLRDLSPRRRALLLGDPADPTPGLAPARTPSTSRSPR